MYCDYVADFLRHANHGMKGDPSYTPVVKYIEFGNEPTLTGNEMTAFARMYSAVRARVHRDFPGVQVGALGGMEIPYTEGFIDQTKGQIDA